jgi:hypothetical protein
MEERSERRLSYTQFSMWMNCPQQWKLTYVDNLRIETPSIYPVFGTAIHLAIQEWLTLVYGPDKFKAKIFDMESVFRDALLEEFKINTKEIDGVKVFPCDKDTLREFYIQGGEILKYIRKHVKDIFPTSGHELVGCEIPLDISINSHLYYIGFIDIVVREKRTGKVYLYDLKTSTKGWNYEKRDPKKLNQLLLYKHFYSKLFDVELNDIEVQFIILKRKLNPNNEWDTKRIVAFEPANGKPSVNKAVASFESFVSNTFDSSGNVILENLTPTPTKSACRFCNFNQTPHCSVGAWKE